MTDDAKITAAILQALGARGAGKTICPSEIARQLWPRDWRARMEAVRICGYMLRDEGQLAVTQGGEEIGRGQIAKGAIRFGRPI